MCALDRLHKSFSLSTLGHRLRSVPMFLVLVPFVAGILIAENYALPLMMVAVLFVLMIAVAAWTLPRKMAWGYVAMAIMLCGYLLAELRAPTSSVPYDETVEMVVGVESVPSERDDYSVADGRVDRWYDGEQWHDVDCRVVLWLRVDSILHGDRLTIAGKLSDGISRHADYNALMHRRGFVGGVGISDHNILSIRHVEPTDMQSLAIRKLDSHATDSASHATVVAMVAGARRDMPKELRAAYSATGLSHLMAVSGLHLGIVLMVVGLLFVPLYFVHGGHRLATLLCIVAIWIYAIMSGVSPSVVRAATMFSVLLFTRVISANYNSVNVLAATVFAMLVYRPGYLFDVSFQLSVAAVFGIIVWCAPLVRGVRLWSRRTMRFAAPFIVGAVATLWTLPIVSHTFGNLPIVGVVLTPCVLLFSYAIVVGGLFAVVLPVALALPFAAVAEWAAGVQNSIVIWAAELPFASVEYAMSGWGVAVCYVTYAAITLLYWSKNQKKVVTLPRHDYD